VVVVNSSFAPNNIAELVALAKKEPGKINFASVGIGSYPHLDMERFMKATGTQMVHVPYKGGAGQAIPAMLGGETQVAFFNMASLLPHIRSGRLKALAAIPAQRLPELPNVPTLTEQGYPGIGTNAWQGMFAPAATPKAIVDRLNAEIRKIVEAPEMKAAWDKQGAVAMSMSPDEFGRFMREDIEKWARVVKISGARADR